MFKGKLLSKMYSTYIPPLSHVIIKPEKNCSTQNNHNGLYINISTELFVFNNKYRFHSCKLILKCWFNVFRSSKLKCQKYFLPLLRYILIWYSIQLIWCLGGAWQLLTNMFQRTKLMEWTIFDSIGNKTVTWLNE